MPSRLNPTMNIPIPTAITAITMDKIVTGTL